MQLNLHPRHREIMQTSHMGKTIDWNIESYVRTKMVKREEDFKEINRFLASLSLNHQQGIFNVLSDIKDIFGVVMEFSEMQNALTNKVTELYSFIPMEEIRYYVKTKARVIYPGDLRDAYSPADTNRAKTYLKDEYKGLVVLVLALRLMIPVWGEYLKLNIKRTGTFKEYLAMRLLSGTELMYCKEMQRLESYVASTGLSKNDRDNAAIRGISSEELPLYLLAILVVRELSIGSIDAEADGRGSIITNVYARVKNSIKDISRSSSPIRDKFRNETNGEDADKSSRLEQYKNVEGTSTGDIEIHKYFVNQSEDLALKVDPTLELSKLEDCLTLTLKMGSFDIEDHNVLLVQWVLCRVVPARAIKELNAHELLKAMGVTQALLWHWGYLDLALLVTTRIDNSRMPIMNASRKQAKKVTTDLINQAFPYHIKTSSKSNSRNPAHRAADEYEKTIRNSFLVPQVPQGLKGYFKEISVNGDWTCPNDLLTQLTDMFAHVHVTLKSMENSNGILSTRELQSNPEHLSGR